jgi:hypothetical protein
MCADKPKNDGNMQVSVQETIRKAERILPGVAAPDREKDPRWQAVIAVGEFVETNPDEVWEFVARWGGHEDDDLRSAIATCLLEHLLEYHFALIFPRVEKAAKKGRLFADMFCRCGKFGQSEVPDNAKRFDQLKDKCRPI